MKKKLVILFSILALTACTQTDDNNANNDNTSSPAAEQGETSENEQEQGQESEETSENEQESEEENNETSESAQASNFNDLYKTGLGIVSDTTGSRSFSSDDEGNAVTTVTVATVVFDMDNNIVDCKIDEIETSVAFNDKGEITSDLVYLGKTKTELGDSYGMKSASSIDKEWYEQAEAFAQWTIGQNVSDVENLKITEATENNDIDLMSSVTIKTSNFTQAIGKAFDNSK